MTSLRVLIVGGGIGGLAAAAGFRRGGHEVTLIEQASEITEVGAGVGLGPNATGALFSLGIRDRLEGSAVAPKASTRRRWQDGTELFSADLAEMKSAFGYPFWFAHRGDLQAALLAAARDADAPGRPADVLLKSRCASLDPEAGTVVTESGEKFQADLVIGADGIRSRIRQEMFGSDTPRFSGNAAYRTQVQVARALEHPDLRTFVERRSFESWLGPNGHVVHAPFRAGLEINVTACLEVEGAIGEGVSTAPSTKDAVLDRLPGWHEPLRHLIETGGPVHRYDIYDLPPLTRWVAGRACLLGDAAHPMLPYLGQGAAQAIEDAELLTRLFATGGADDIDATLAEFERVRIPRTTRVQQLSAANRHLFHMHDGPEQRARDEQIARGSSDSEVYRWLWACQAPSDAPAVH